MTRTEHLEWAKARALECAEAGEYGDAIASLLSDLGKHEETRSLLDLADLRDALEVGQSKDPERVRRWIEKLS